MNRSRRRPSNRRLTFHATRIAALIGAMVAASLAARPAHQSSDGTGDSRRAPRTRVVILGVDHSAQLVSEANSPGLLSAFIDRVHPDVICIERPPEQAARGDFYEFTYEVQGVVLPYAAAHRIEIRPVDWMPSLEDQKLAFGLDLDEPPEVRPAQGFQAFLTFPDPKALQSDLFAAEDSSTTAPAVEWSAKSSERADRDFPRRLYLYRHVPAGTNHHPRVIAQLLPGKRGSGPRRRADAPAEREGGGE